MTPRVERASHSSVPPDRKVADVFPDVFCSLATLGPAVRKLMVVLLSTREVRVPRAS